MNQMKVATHVLNGRRVGYFVDLVTLGSAETLKEALDYGYVTGKESSLTAVAEGVCKAMIDGIRKDGNGRKIDDFISINAFAKGSLKDICDELTRANARVSVRARRLFYFRIGLMRTKVCGICLQKTPLELVISAGGRMRRK